METRLYITQPNEWLRILPLIKIIKLYLQKSFLEKLNAESSSLRAEVRGSRRSRFDRIQICA
jgi:hypothetical protein